MYLTEGSVAHRGAGAYHFTGPGSACVMSPGAFRLWNYRELSGQKILHLSGFYTLVLVIDFLESYEQTRLPVSLP